MRRTAAEIKAFILDRISQKAALSVLASNTDDNALFKQFIECIADELSEHHDVAADHVQEIEDILSFANAHSATWIAKKALEFQYDEDVPQVLVSTDGVVGYETVDESKRIITNCVVRTSASRQVGVSVAKGSPLEKLSDLELEAFDSYLNSVLETSYNLAGVSNVCASVDPDYCYIKAEVKYKGLHANIIEANVTEAIENYLSNLGILGRVGAYQLREAVLAVDGVTDFIIEDMAIRSNAIPFGAGASLVTAFVDGAFISVETTAGYAYTEIEPGEELENRLTFTNV